MIGKCKKIVKDIGRKIDLENNVTVYSDLLKSQYNCYSTVKMCMNYYTMKEMLSEQQVSEDVKCFFDSITDMINQHIFNRQAVGKESVEQINNIRDNVEYKMKNLTAFTDGYEIYEYILNRIEAGIKGTTEEVNIEQLSAKMFQYVFCENDTVVINSKLQLLMSQLPVRMTKNKFYDIVTNTLSIYKGGEVESVDDFVDMLRTAVLIKQPEGFDTEYPKLYKVYTDLKNTDYKNVDEKLFDTLTDELNQAAAFINEEVSVLMLLQEIVNDVYSILLTVDASYESNTSLTGYKAALDILGACIENDDFSMIPEEKMPQFIAMEGVQEDTYENIMILETVLDDVRDFNQELITKLDLVKVYEDLSIVSKLLSTSLFIDLDKDFTKTESVIADNAYIMKQRDAVTADFAKIFAEESRMVNRSIMCKILASMPIFLNSQQEIKNYFDYVLENCKDDSELTACFKLVSEIIDED